MKEKVMGCARKIYGIEIPKKVLDRLDYEFKIIEECNLESDLIHLSEVINKWRSKRYFINGLGNLKESLIAYLLGIIDVNPINLNKLFELDFSNKSFEIVLPKQIEQVFDNDLKGKEVGIKINYNNWFHVELLSKLEYECDVSDKDILFDDIEIIKRFIKKAQMDEPLSILDSFEWNYGIETPFGMYDEKLITFYDYVNYDKDYNDEYSTDLVLSYYINYFRVYFPDVFYQIYIDCLIESLASNKHYEQIHKMQYLKIQIVDIYNRGCELKGI